MAIMQLPLIKGLGKECDHADYIDALPVNMLATPKPVLNASGYLRSFPGIARKAEVAGVSRGVQYNTHEKTVYRGLGNQLYKGHKPIADLAGKGRISMAFSRNSQAVAAAGKMTLYRYDGTVKTLENWPKDKKYTQYDIGTVRDMCHLRGRYVWCKDGSDIFGVTDLEDESHPDRYRALYRAESQPDGIIGIDSWRDFIVCFGTSTIEYFSLTGAADGQSAIYAAQPALMVEKGIAGTHCKTRLGDAHVIISHQTTGAPSVYLINQAQATSIATATIEKMLRRYTHDELASAVMETVRFDSHELVLIHLPRQVLCYDAASNQNGPQWSLLKTGFYHDPYRGIDFIFADHHLTCGDKHDALLGQLDFASAAQYEKPQEHILYTPLFKADNARVFDFELEASTGVAHIADRLFLSTTADGIHFGREQMINQNAPFAYDRRILWRRIGRVRKNLGFKVRVITSSPVTLSGCQIRME